LAKILGFLVIQFTQIRNRAYPGQFLALTNRDDDNNAQGVPELQQGVPGPLAGDDLTVDAAAEAARAVLVERMMMYVKKNSLST
jgi:hypothetical protein